MFLRALTLTNYRKFRNEMIEFPEGIIGITGPNGVGKSTILEAIGWALYGHDLTRSSNSEVKSQTAEESDTCRVILEFDMGGHSYKIIRELKGKNATSNALIFTDGADVPDAQRERGVNEFIERLLGMDYVSFIRTVYAKQKDIAALSTLTPEKRKEVIRRMLNIDRIDDAVVMIRRDRRSKNDYISGVEAGLSDIDEIRERIKQTIAELKDKECATASLQAAASELNEAKDKLRLSKETEDDKFGRFATLDAERARLEEKRSSLETQITSLNQELGTLNDKKSALAKIIHKLDEYESVKRDKEDMDSLRIKYNQRAQLEKIHKDNLEDKAAHEENLQRLAEDLKPFANVETDASEIESRIKNAENERKKAEQTARKLQGAVSALEAKLAELSGQNKNVMELGPDSECPTCLRKMGDSHQDILEHLDKEISDYSRRHSEAIGLLEAAEKQQDSIMEGIELLVAEKNDANARLGRKREIDQEIRGHKAELDKTIKRLEQRDKELQQLAHVEFDENNYESLVARLDELTKTRDTILTTKQETERIDTIKSQKHVLEEERSQCLRSLEDVKGQIDAIGFDKKIYEETKASFDAASDKCHKSAVDLEKSKGELSLVKHRLKELKDTVKDQKAQRKMIENIKTEIQYLQRLEGLFLDFRLELTGRMRPMLESRVSELFSEVTEGRYPIIELDEDYELSIIDSDESFKLARFSGGEEDLANLCLRIAMSQVISERSGGAQINFIALDEIFGSQDEKRRQNILNALNRLSSQFRQIMLITHIEDIKDMFPRALKVEEDPYTRESKILVS